MDTALDRTENLRAGATWDNLGDCWGKFCGPNDNHSGHKLTCRKLTSVFKVIATKLAIRMKDINSTKENFKFETFSYRLRNLLIKRSLKRTQRRKKKKTCGDKKEVSTVANRKLNGHQINEMQIAIRKMAFEFFSNKKCISLAGLGGIIGEYIWNCFIFLSLQDFLSYNNI